MNVRAKAAEAETLLRERQADLCASLADSLRKLTDAREDLRRTGLTPTAVGQVYMRAHDLKSLGTHGGFPVISRLAAAICQLFDDPAHLPADQMGLVDDHLDAIRAFFDDGVATEDDPRAAPILAELDRDLLLR